MCYKGGGVYWKGGSVCYNRQRAAATKVGHGSYKAR
jgi:hypothetical protein